MDTNLKISIYARSALFLIGILALLTILYLAQDIIVPLVFALLIAIVLHPVVNMITRRGVNRLAAIVITLILTFLVLTSLGILLYTQASKFGESWPALVDKFGALLNQSITVVAEYLNITPKYIHNWISKTEIEVINSSSASLGSTLTTLGGVLATVLLIPFYIFMILFYQSHLVSFTHQVFGASNNNSVNEILTQTKSIIQSYLFGLFAEFSIISIMNSAGLMILDIDYAILLGIIGALLNIIPYIGGLVAVALPMMVALATKTSGWYAFYVLAVYYFIQLIDNNYIVPVIVASKVKINGLFSVIAVIAGNYLWGISGMFLSIPLLAIIKLIFDHIEPLKPWGFLLGNIVPTSKRNYTFRKKRKIID